VARAWFKIGPMGRACFIPAAVIAAATFVSTLAPPSSMDAMVYHLRMPTVYLAQGRWVLLTDIAQTFYPAYVEMAFGHALAVESDVAAALVHWALGVGAALSAGAWARRFGARPWLAALFVLGTPLFVWESTGAFIDLGLALFGSLAIYWASRTDVGRCGAILAGVFAGLAAGSKLTGAALAVLAGATAAVVAWPQWAMAIKRLVTIGAIALIVALPWYLHNWVRMGNPFYPVGNALFAASFPGFEIPHYGYGRSLLNFVSSPFDLVWRGAPFDQGWAVGPALLALVPLGAFVGRRIQLVRIAAACILAFWAFWFYSTPQTRMLLPMFPVGAALAALAADAALAAKSRILRVAVVATATLSTLVGVIVALAFARSYAPAAFGIESRDAFLTRVSWHYPAYQAANARIPQGARVAVIGADNLYYLRREARIVDPKTTDAELRREGFSHLLAVRPCDDPRPRASVVWSGQYGLPASRLGGGVAEVVCAWIETL